MTSGMIQYIVEFSWTNWLNCIDVVAHLLITHDDATITNNGISITFNQFLNKSIDKQIFDKMNFYWVKGYWSSYFNEITQFTNYHIENNIHILRKIWLQESLIHTWQR